MALTDPLTSIPVHESTLRILRNMKTGGETWDQFLLAVTDTYLSPAMRLELDRRLRAERVIPGAEMQRRYEERKRRVR